MLIGLLVAFELVPLVWLVMGSLKTQQEFLNAPMWQLPQQLQWQNYIEAWTAGNIATYMQNSVVVTAASIAAITVLGVAAGFALEVMVWRGRRTVLLGFLLGIMIPGQMILLPLFSVYHRTGLSGSLWPLIITYTATGIPLTVFMMATYFRAVPRETFEAATLDGASVYRTFSAVAVPMVRNAVVTVAIVHFLFIWNDLLIALTFTSRRELRTLQVGLLSFTEEYGVINYGPLFAAICINMAGVLILYLFLNQRIMRGLTAGSVKG